MKKLLLGFLMLVMVMPGLACAMPQCMHEESAGHAFAGNPCHGHEHEGEKKASHGVMLFKDCAKADLWKAAGDAVVKKPGIAGKAFILAAVSVQDPSFYTVPVLAIRGPPPDRPDLVQSQPPILLRTLRFRE